MSTLQEIETHRRNVARRTTLSVVCYAGFVVTSVASAFQGRPLEDPVTLAAIFFIIASFMILPRDYVTAALARKASTDDEIAEIDGLRRHQQIGLGIRVAYALGALVTLLVIPAMLS